NLIFAATIPSSSDGTSSVTLSHRYGPCSPADPNSGEKRPTDEELLRRDQLRADYIRRKFSGSNGTAAGEDGQSSKVSVPTTLGSSLDTLEYVISVGLGSPAMTQRVVIDTGSDVSWVQCEPCPAPSPCHAHAGALFDPAASSTYAAFNCSAAACAQLGDSGEANGCDAKSRCQYIGLPVRVQPRRAGRRHGRQDRRPHRPRRRRAVAGVADGGEVRQVLLLLPPGDAGLVGVPHAGRAGERRRRRRVAVRDDADAQEQEGPDVLLRGPGGHRRGREEARAVAVGVRRRVAGGLRHGDHAAAAGGVRGAVVGVPSRDDAVREGGAPGHSRHVLQLHRPGQGQHTDRRAGVRRRRRRRPRRARHRVRRLPRVRAHPRRQGLRHHRQRAAAHVRGPVRRRRRRLRLPRRRLLIGRTHERRGWSCTVVHMHAWISYRLVCGCEIRILLLYTFAKIHQHVVFIIIYMSVF
ncbi:hypothetical protein EE612_003982, partial [Oryza sativa]